MKEGMWWLDSDPRTTLEEKIKRVARHYKRKHGKPANVCYVHPTMLSDKKSVVICGVDVKPMRNIMKHNFWIGREEEDA
jgi:hypothetical protein